MGKSKHKHKKEKKKKRRKSSSSDTSYEEEWVVEDEVKVEKTKFPDKVESNDWLDHSDDLFVTTEKKDKKEKVKPPRPTIDELGKSNRELNPYWKDGGSGLPNMEKSSVHVGSVGDLGLDWLKRSLRRAEQRAQEENKPLEEVVAQTWGSLEKLQEMIKEAENKGQGRRHYDRYSSTSGWRKQSSDRHVNAFRKPREDDSGWDGRREEKRKNERKLSTSPPRRDRDNSNISKESLGWTSRDLQLSEKIVNELASTSREESDVRQPPTKGRALPTRDELNDLHAKLIKAEIMGDEDVIKELKAKIEKLKTVKSTGGIKEREEGDRVRVLSQTNAKGFTQPVAFGRTDDGRYFNKSKKYRSQNAEDCSIQELFQKEKFISAADENEMFSAAAKRARHNRDEDDSLDVLEASSESLEAKSVKRNVIEQNKREKRLENCSWCLESPRSADHLIVSVMDKVYLSVPPYHSITEGHCLVVPTGHTPCATLLDEDIWEQIMDLKKLLVNLFLEEGRDIIFYENARYLNKFPHMVLHCVPLPKEIGDEAPIYFKKAILECETEWSNNKKLVDLKGRDIRKAVPKGLPYFWVDFGLQSGFAHVIEDEQLFPKNFAEEIIGGMMDLDHQRWRKRKKDTDDIQKKKAQELIRKFKAFLAKK